MTDLTNGIAQAIQLILSGDAALFEIILLTLQVTGAALALAMLAGIPLGAALGLSSAASGESPAPLGASSGTSGELRARGHAAITVLLYTGMGLPPVVVGLFIYLLLSRSGPLGALGWLFTPAAMVAAQFVIAFPLAAGLTMTAVQSVDPALRLQARALGATHWQELWTVLLDARIGVIAAIVAGFGSIISEVGAVMLVGGNIEGKTRVLTTAIVLDTRTGEFALALALGLILLALAFLINGGMFLLQRRALD